MTKKLLLPVLFLICIGNLQAQQNLPAFLADSIDRYVEKALDMWQIPGAAVCVVKDGKVMMMKGYGIREIGRTDKVDENTLFMIGSNTKAFTGTALALLENDGKCTLEDKVQKWIPDFSMKDPWVAKELNLTDIVSHRIGMETFQGDFMYWTSDLSAEEVIKRFGELVPKYAFRTRYGYTNAGYAIAGECIKKMTGKSWADFIRERILVPLKMKNTLPLSADLATAGNIAKAHTFENTRLVKIPFPAIDNLAPAGSISSSVADMSHWVIAQLDSGKYEGKEIFPYSVLQKTRKPNTISGRTSNMFDRNPFSVYGLGWAVESYKGKEVVSHTGGVDGFVTSVTLIPQENLGIVVLTNTDANSFYQALKWEIIDSFMKLPFRNYSKIMFDISRKTQSRENEILSAQRDTINMQLKPAVDLKEFTGKYVHPVYGFLTIIQKGNELEMSFQHHPGMKGKLESLGGKRFLCTYSNPTFGIKVIPFKIDGTEVKSLTLRVADFVEFTTYEFVKD